MGRFMKTFMGAWLMVGSVLWMALVAVRCLESLK